MPNLKAYTLGNNGFISADVLDTLGLPDHTRQASVMVFAASKADAIRTLEAHSQQRAIRYTPKLSDPEFRMTTSPWADAFLDSWIDEPTIVVKPMITTGEVTPVARILDDGRPEFWGVLRRINGTIVFSREQMPEDER
jgi:hypothetical protein